MMVELMVEFESEHPDQSMVSRPSHACTTDPDDVEASFLEEEEEVEDGEAVDEGDESLVPELVSSGSSDEPNESFR